MSPRFLASLAALALPLDAAPAQPSTPAPEAAAVRHFVEAVTVETEGQVARFHEPVCPLSRGLPPDYNHVVEERVRAIARAVGIPVGRPAGCLPNLIVLVAEDGEAVTETLRGERPDIFAGLDSAEIRRAIAGGGPVRTWQSSVTRRAEGAPIAENRDSYLFQDVHLFHGVPAGLLRETTRRDLRLSMILFDVDAIDGLTLMQLADHAAMRGLAPTRSAAAAAGKSILALFDESAAGRDPPQAATEWDGAYLRALYRADASLDGRAQRSSLARLLERNLRPTRGR
ncbi:MAG TPA: hypothetical protein VN231_13250 [Allosphingosinicella sp.]|nr:hypothetical protein [Allosphingosinicella sp.]